MPTTEEKFNAAVNVIKSLPKNGAYQPSNELMLKFYSYFKQATEGPCKGPKPGFWEVVKKAKWDAWMRLGNMSKEEAMRNYVEELKKVVEVMSNSDMSFGTGDLDAFNQSVPVKDLELVVGPVMERIRSQTNSPIPFTDEPPRKENGYKTNGDNIDDINAYSAETETEDEFIDSVETNPVMSHKKFTKTHINGDDYEYQNSRKFDYNYSSVSSDKDFINQISMTVKCLQRDLDQVNIRISNIEQQVQLLTKNQVNSNQGGSSISSWPLPKSPSQLLILIILWPFVTQFLVYLLKRRHQRKV